MLSIREEIAKNILYYRKRSGLLQRELADLVDVHPTAVSNWETGKNSIDIETLVKVCKALNVKLNDMLGVYADNITEYESEHERSVLNAYRNNPAMQPAVDTLLGIKPGPADVPNEDHSREIGKAIAEDFEMVAKKNTVHES